MIKMLLLILVTLLSWSSTMASSPSCTVRENAMIDEINYARTNPAEYSKYIDEYLEIWGEIEGMINEGNKLKKIMLDMQPVHPLEFSQILYDQSKKHGIWMKQTRRFDHSDFDTNYGENLCSRSESVRMAVVDLLIDYGIKSYGHRLNIFNPNYKYVAVHEVPGKVGNDDYVFIQQFATNALVK